MTTGQPRRTVRVPDALWEEVRDIALERGETLADVVRRGLERYVRSWARGKKADS